MPDSGQPARQREQQQHEIVHGAPSDLSWMEQRAEVPPSPVAWGWAWCRSAATARQCGPGVRWPVRRAARAKAGPAVRIVRMSRNDAKLMFPGHASQELGKRPRPRPRPAVVKSLARGAMTIQDQREEAHGHSGWLIPLGLVCAILLLSGLFLGWYLRPGPRIAQATDKANIGGADGGRRAPSPFPPISSPIPAARAGGEQAQRDPGRAVSVLARLFRRRCPAVCRQCAGFAGDPPDRCAAMPATSAPPTGWRASTCPMSRTQRRRRAVRTDPIWLSRRQRLCAATSCSSARPQRPGAAAVREGSARPAQPQLHRGGAADRARA